MRGALMDGGMPSTTLCMVPAQQFKQQLQGNLSIAFAVAAASCKQQQSKGAALSAQLAAAEQQLASVHDLLAQSQLQVDKDRHMQEELQQQIACLQHLIEAKQSASCHNQQQQPTAAQCEHCEHAAAVQQHQQLTHNLQEQLSSLHNQLGQQSVATQHQEQRSLQLEFAVKKLQGQRQLLRTKLQQQAVRVRQLQHDKLLLKRAAEQVAAASGEEKQQLQGQIAALQYAQEQQEKTTQERSQEQDRQVGCLRTQCASYAAQLHQALQQRQELQIQLAALQAEHAVLKAAAKQIEQHPVASQHCCKQDTGAGAAGSAERPDLSNACPEHHPGDRANSVTAGDASLSDTGAGSSLACVAALFVVGGVAAVVMAASCLRKSASSAPSSKSACRLGGVRGAAATALAAVSAAMGSCLWAWQMEYSFSGCWWNICLVSYDELSYR